ncbi:anillin isoform X7 [Gymnodraco acuticeps]|uniref:Anillin isoform X7 n=1 Tax=Gymnodraco acuticeps TaxID=8218 RepID=A0A6P8SZC4_GYMAC|nr:anillin isoform X7 [Gymnodraco acuticeps]
MEAGEENVGNVMKRQRTPLSDSEDNVLSAPDVSECNDGQKRRRLEAAGQENCSPKPSSGRKAELETKPDTPMVSSVRSRVQQLTQRREGGAPLAQRCLSDPGVDSPLLILQEKGFKEHLLREGEFNQRLERFKVPVFQTAPPTTASSANISPRTPSKFVSAIQQKLQGSAAPSSMQASRIRQERELNQLPFQPISENAWLKRSSSDPSLSQGWTPLGPSSSVWVPRSTRRVCWPPMQPWDQMDDDAVMKDGSFTEASTSGADAELSSHDETNTAEIIDQMFDEVLEYAGRMEEQRRDEDTEDSGIGICSGDKEKIDMESEKEKSEEERESKEKHCDESNKDELLTFPSSGILSPLSKSLEAVVTPLRLEASQDSIPPSLLLTPEETTTPVSESAPLYSIDAYRTQRQNKAPSIQSVTPGVQRRAPEKSRPQPSVNTREKITTLNEEAGKLQNVISQTLQALSCCTDEEHGRGSLEEAEAEKLLLVSCEKRSALLAEVARLREERGSESGEEGDYVPQLPCRGTVSITNIQLPLKVEFVCSSHNRTGRPSHFFFVLIRYGPCNIDATPLATAADAKNGDTISFPTSVILKDIRSSFEIDVEVYSLSHTSGGNSSMDRASAKSRVTPRKLLNTLKRSSHSHSLTSAALPALNPRRSSNFCLVGSHKIDLASLGHGKFPLDKMKLEGKIRRLLGDEFQEKVPFLSPLEGNIYLQLNSKGHSSVQHQGFLTMFEMISGYGVWHRRYFVLMGCTMSYWNHPNDRESKDAEGSISLSSTSSQCVRPVKRDSCARPFTFELVSSVPQQQDAGQDTFAKRWFSADSKEERLDWMEQLNQALLDFHTWNRTPGTQSQQSNTCSSGNLRESIL